MPQLKYKDALEFPYKVHILNLFKNQVLYYLRLGLDLLHFGKSLFSKLHGSYATAISRQSHLFLYGLVYLEDIPL